MFLHKYKTEAGPAYLVSGSQKPKTGLRLTEWEGKATGTKIESILKALNSISVFKEDQPKEDEPVEEKKAVTLASRIRELASFLTSKE